MKATFYNYVTQRLEAHDDALLSDRIARQLIPQDRVTQDIYVYARRLGCDIREAMSRAILEGKQQ